MRDLTQREHRILDYLGKALIEFGVLEEPAHPNDIGDFQTCVVACQNIVLARPATESLGLDYEAWEGKSK